MRSERVHFEFRVSLDFGARSAIALRLQLKKECLTSAFGYLNVDSGIPSVGTRVLLISNFGFQPWTTDRIELVLYDVALCGVRCACLLFAFCSLQFGVCNFHSVFYLVQSVCVQRATCIVHCVFSARCCRTTGAVQCGLVRCVMMSRCGVRCGAVLCGVVRCGVVRCGAVRCGAM